MPPEEIREQPGTPAAPTEQSQPPQGNQSAVDERVARIESLLADTEVQSRRVRLTQQAEEGWRKRLHDAEQELQEANRLYQQAVDNGSEGQEFLVADSRRIQAAVQFQLARTETDRERRELMQALQQKDTSNLNAWRARNQWYGQDQNLTNAANAVHAQIMGEGRVQEGTSEYFNEIDRRMRDAHPEQFGNHQFAGGNYGYQSPARAAQGQGRGQQGLRMDASQVNAMKRMGMTPDNWAAGRAAAAKIGALSDQPVYGNLWVN